MALHLEKCIYVSRFQSDPIKQLTNFFSLVTAADECTDGVDYCEINMNPVGINKDGDLCYGK